MRITLDELLTLCEKILGNAQQFWAKKIDIDFDWYWVISYESMYDFNNPKLQLDMGSLVDDWHYLKEVLSDKNPTSIVDVDRVGNIIKILSAKIHNKEKAIVKE